MSEVPYIRKVTWPEWMDIEIIKKIILGDKTFKELSEELGFNRANAEVDDRVFSEACNLLIEASSIIFEKKNLYPDGDEGYRISPFDLEFDSGYVLLLLATFIDDVAESRGIKLQKDLDGPLKMKIT